MSPQPPATSVVMRFGVFELNPASGELRKSGILIHLAPQSAKVLALLASHAGELLTREQIRQALWDATTFVDFEQGLNHCITQIRAALGDDAGASRFVQTLPRRGYRFLTPVVLVTAAPQAAGRVSREPEQVLGSAPSAGAGQLGGAWAVWILAAACLGPVVYVGVHLWREQQRLGAAAGPSVPTVALLPLVNQTGNPTAEHFAEGLTGEIIDKLGEGGQVSVIGRVSVCRRRDSTPSQIAHDLGADVIVRGSLLRHDSRVGITLEVLTASGGGLPPRTYESDGAGIAGLIVQCARAIAREVPEGPGHFKEPPGWARIQEVPLTAFEHYLDARRCLQLGETGTAELSAAAEHFKEATTLAPGWQPAHVGRALVSLRQWTTSSVPLAKAQPMFQTSLERALAIDETGAETNHVRALNSWYFFWNWEVAEMQFQRAVEANPSLVDVRRDFARFLALSGEFAKATEQAQRALKLDPHSAAALTTVGDVHRIARQYDRALVACRHAIELDPRHAGAWQLRESIYRTFGLRDEEVESYRQQLVLQGTVPWEIENMLGVYNRFGYEAYLRWRLGRPCQPHTAVLLLAHLGRKQEAIDLLQKAYADHWWALVTLGTDPQWDVLRPDARFQTLLRMMNFPGQEPMAED